MTYYFFKAVSICAQIFHYLCLFAASMVTLGTFLFVIFKTEILAAFLDIDFELTFPYTLLIIIGIIAVLVLLCMSFSARYFSLIMKHFSIKNYFAADNTTASLKIALLSTTMLLLQLAANLILDKYHVENASTLFETSHTDYFFTIFMTILSFSAYLVFKHGKRVQDDSESII